MPRIPNKPDFPNPATAELKQTLEKVKKAVEEATDANGEVSLDEVETKLAGDAAAGAAFDAVREHDGFERTETRTRNVGCGGGTETYEARVGPDKLEGAEVQSVLSALLSARGAIDAKDVNADGRIDKGEAATDGADNLAGEIADAVVELTVDEFESQMDDWAGALRDVRRDIDSRGRYENRIQDVCGNHAETELGRQALAWSFREVFAEGGHLSWDDMHTKLKNAETHFLRFLPLFGSPRRNHLSEKEVKGLLGTSDLQGFIDGKREAIKDMLGGTWEEHWLEGKDLEGADQLDDPDLQGRSAFASSGC
jgi:hypothetical protein